MSKMALLWLALYFGNIAGALRHPIFPLVAYLVFYYMPPHLNWWGRNVLPDLRYSMLASAALIAALVVFRSNLEPLKPVRNPAMVWLAGWGLNTVAVTAWALQVARSWGYTVACLKLVLLYTLIPAAVRAPAHFDTFAAVHVAGAAYWGYKAWDNPKRAAGRLQEVGGPDAQNDNQAAGHLVTVLPFAALYVLTEKRKALRALHLVGGAFVLNVFILCNSRGATVGLIVAGLAAIVLAGHGKRGKLIAVAIAGAAATFYLADPQFIERQQTTTDPQDGSAQSRWVMWAGGIEMVKDYPFGGGGRTFHILSSRYIPEILERNDAAERSPHNTYIQLATDWGVQGAVLFFGFMFATFRMLHRIRKRAPDNPWYYYRSLTIEVALIGTMAAAFFSNRLLGESIYWMCALAFALYRMQLTELEAAAAPEAASGEPVVARDELGRASIAARQAAG
ncbi:MAG: O-antigen ligase family protein [Acidobacteria bacterium]|nr:O-antigen ligase family protein [Acidobacteriota bacterium]